MDGPFQALSQLHISFNVCCPHLGAGMQRSARSTRGIGRQICEGKELGHPLQKAGQHEGIKKFCCSDLHDDLPHRHDWQSVQTFRCTIEKSLSVRSCTSTASEINWSLLHSFTSPAALTVLSRRSVLAWVQVHATSSWLRHVLKREHRRTAVDLAKAL